MKQLKTIILLSMVLLTIALQPAEARKVQKTRLTIASFNLRMDTKDDGINQWSNRKELVKSLIRFHDFDIVGTQEGFKHMLDGVAELPEYAWIGEGRDGGDDGEHSAIFYKRVKYELLKHGDFWYSETPNQVGLGWDAKCCNRICSWGKFRDKLTGKVFFVFNSHYDHEGEVARRESSKLLLKKIREIAGTDATVFATGDFNAVPTDEPIQTLLGDGLLADSYRITQQAPYGTTCTYHGYKVPKPGNDYRIDYVFVTKDIRILQYGSLNELPYGRFPSDHFPIMVKAEM
ncbi:endonuclease/exonuclease/phosphatase family protein [Prevotella sp. DNF00663]|uniref:endonuclease/exonuclease/phosphatase family protein n=1 Tax=unclassified Prevotella TaxID=2638335 RepID=UPI0005135251|nr:MULTISPECIES: endonuclease/exonuclease/phosphatase family protein [unclassified Prevotella]KGI61282.1 endonuclease [Prevotella sp. S7 MS 2]KXB83672.1 endonuclease/exonuclease/phosphatase family protein [Prevotella sp. DNF00663]